MSNNRFKKPEDNDINYKKNCNDNRRNRTRNLQQSQQENVPEVKKKKLRVLKMKTKYDLSNIKDSKNKTYQ